MVHKKKLILCAQKNIKLLNKWQFVDNKTDYAAYLKNAVNFAAA
jgi:hypothetical protein